MLHSSGKCEKFLGLLNIILCGKCWNCEEKYVRRWCRLIQDIVLETFLYSNRTSGTHLDLKILSKLNFELFHAEMMAVDMELVWQKGISRTIYQSQRSEWFSLDSEL
jgi:hypothetical protein